MQVIVVGAGIAGITVTKELRKKGWPREKVLLLEARADVGGRVSGHGVRVGRCGDRRECVPRESMVDEVVTLRTRGFSLSRPGQILHLNHFASATTPSEDPRTKLPLDIVGSCPGFTVL